MELKFRYIVTDGWYVGFLEDYPDHWTQGKTLEELKMMLVSLWEDIENLDLPGVV
jgi:predicted RNase H-like HicB family nuclease